MKMGRPARAIKLSDEQREKLTAIANSHKAERRAVLRAEIILRCDQHMSNENIAADLGINVNTVQKWRKRFHQYGMDGLNDSRRPGKPPRITTGDRLRIVNTVVKPPEPVTRWSIRDLTEELNRQGLKIGKSTVHEILMELDLKPHQFSMWLNSTDPDFTRKEAEIIGLYMNPPENALLLSVDEKTQMQALSHDYRRQMKEGSPEKIDSHYHRHSVLSLFAALFIHRGDVLGKIKERHRHQEFIEFLDMINDEVPWNMDIHIICDNLSVHKHEQVRKWLISHPIFHIHFTPTHASWLNQVELWFNILQRKVIDRGEFPDKEDLSGKIVRFIEIYNDTGKPFSWTYTGKVLTI